MVISGTVAVVKPQIGVRNKHGISGAIASCLGASACRSVYYYWPRRVVVATRDSFIDFGNIEEQRGSDAVSQSIAGDGNAWEVQVIEGCWLEGLWAATQLRFGAEASVQFWSNTAYHAPAGPTTPDQMVEIRRIAIESIDREEHLMYPRGIQSMIASSHWHDAQVLPMGWLINTATLAGLAMFACTARGVRRDVRSHRRMVKLHRKHCCGWCGYDIRGLGPSTATCPECGKRLSSPTGA